MGQQQVYDFMRKHPDKWFTSRQISEEMKASLGSVTNALCKLRNTNAIFYKISEKRSTMYLYMFEDK